MTVNTRFIIFMVVVVAAVLVGFAILVQRNSGNIDRLQGNVEDLQGQVRELNDFVDELREETPDEIAQNQAVSDAVRQVPEIKAILCEQFPLATACRVPG